MFGRTSSHQCVPHATGMYQCSSCCMSCLCIQLGAQKQSQGLQYSPARLQEQLGATQAQEQQSLQQLSRTNEAIQGLHRKVAELQQQLCWQVQDMENLQAELAQARQESTKQAEKIAAYKTHRQQLHRELRRMQTFKEQSKQEVLQSNNLTAPALRDSAELPPPGGRATRATSSRTRSSTKQSKD
ncbi:polyamine-modulated factor 1-binding protein 1-like [Molothrus ater]|uniref:polyamine-modulated factor 1-binding protein 1-like n=1 Tax=Molothrus ater TaxID=84834 RepID=UPI0017488617|nr:polyamine-modulated factor 1-binding protein 1-like [Molothrus ater]